MGAFSQVDTPEQFRGEGWDADELVLIRTRLNVAEQRAMVQATAQVKQSGMNPETDEAGIIVIDALAKRLIVGWTFKDERGNKLPYSPEKFDELSPDYGNDIYNRIGELIADWAEKQQQ